MPSDDHATDRLELSRSIGHKPSRWPRTERRRSRIEAVLGRRQPDLTVVLENVHDPHNVSAVLRSCDAVGVLNIHVIYSVEAPPERAYARTTSASAAKWIEVIRHDSVEGCFDALRSQDFTIVAAALGEGSADLFDLDLTRPTALVFGNEMRGISQEVTALADATMTIPMMGMVQSLNISVACAVTLYEAFRQRRLAGRYEGANLASNDMARLIEDWLRR